MRATTSLVGLTAATLAAAAPFSPGTLALLGVGDGATTLSTTVLQGAVYEVDPNGTTVRKADALSAL
jgi:hypothetical protein